MSEQELFRALNQHLSTFTSVPQPEFSWGNEEYKPSLNMRYLRAELGPARPRTLTASNPIASELRGLYQISCYVDERYAGMDGAWGLAGDVVLHFFPSSGDGLYLTGSSGLLVQIEERPETSPLSALGGFVGVAVLVRYLAQVVGT